MELDPDELQFVLQQARDDTGFFCRQICGWNYDEDGPGKRMNVGTGGIRKTGGHKKIVTVLDSERKYKHIQAPRAGYKSSILQGFVGRHIVRNPNVRILYGMKDDEKASAKALAIRNMLELPLVTKLFGAQRGPKWEGDRFTVAGRSMVNLQEPTLSTFSLKSLPTGGHYDIIILDDLIDADNCRTKEALANAKRILRLCQPLMTTGSIFVIVGTRYDEDDIYNEAANNPLFQDPLGHTLILGAGVRVIKTPDGKVDLEQEEFPLPFPQLTMDVLRQRLYGMTSDGKFRDFCLQYLNWIPTNFDAAFARQQFQPVKWDDGMKNLSGYLLTDTATSQKKEGCYSVLAYVLLDERDNCYLADLRVGKWHPPEFIEHFFKVLEHWNTRVNHCGECWEEIALVQVFDIALRTEARQRRVKLNPMRFPRRSQNDKLTRIMRLQPVFSKRQFYVLDSVPRTFLDLDGEKLLWDPEGYRDGRSGAILPGGELVDEFLRLNSPNSKKDIPDTISMAFETLKDSTRHCRFRRMVVRERPALQLEPDLVTVRSQPSHDDYWDRIRREGNF